MCPPQAMTTLSALLAELPVYVKVTRMFAFV